jgi:hypothetical protein
MAEAAYEAVHVILAWNGGGWITRGFWIENGNATEVRIEIAR